MKMMKNSTLIGSSLLGTWTAQTQLSTPEGDDQVTAYFIVHFMADPRKGLGCSLTDCNEVDNQVCLLEPVQDKNDKLEDRLAVPGIQKVCRDMAQEKDVSWSDLTVFFNFGIQVHSASSSPKAQFEMSTGDWIGPFNVIMAQDTATIVRNDPQPQPTLVDRYVARYVTSQSMHPLFLQNTPPNTCTLYNQPDDFATFLGSAALEHMTRVQTNISIANMTGNDDDPYAPYLQTCRHGSVPPMLPQVELNYFVSDDKNQTINTTRTLYSDDNNDNNDDHDNVMAFELLEWKFQYKIMAVPLPQEQAYRVLPQLQSKFQGQGGYNIIGGPYCYQDDPGRGYSLDLNYHAVIQKNSESQSNATIVLRGTNDATTLIRGCRDGYPCIPPAAMGVVPNLPANDYNFNNSCDSHHHHTPSNVIVSNLVLSFACYGLAIAFLLSVTLNFHLSHQHKQDAKKYKRRELVLEQQEADNMMTMLMGTSETSNQGRNHGGGDFENADDDKPTYFGAMNLLKGGGDIISGIGHAATTTNNEDVGPFGDLDQEEAKVSDPLQQPLLSEDRK